MMENAGGADQGLWRRISVAMCTYNGEAYLAEQLDSIVRQSHPAHEIVICDDVSTDGTWALLEEYSNQYPNLIRIVYNDGHLGPVKNFEKAVSMCTGNLIALSDQDDVWRRDKLEILAHRFKEKPNLGLIFSNAELIDAKGERLSDADLWQVVGFNRRARAAVRNGDVLRTLLRKPFATGCTIMFRAALKAVCLPISEHLMHDYWISLAAAAYSRIEYVDERLVCYRQHSTNQVGAPRMSVKQRIDYACLMGVLQCEQDVMGLEELVAHLDRSGRFDQDSLTLIRQKTDFLRSRLELWSDDAPWCQRASMLARNMLWGRYGRWSNALATLTKDLALLLGIVRRPGSSTTRIPRTGA